MHKWLLILTTFVLPISANANSLHEPAVMAQTHTWIGLAVLICFVVAYGLVMTEDITHLNKSKPVVFAAGIIWILVATAGNMTGQSDVVNANLNYALLEYGELFLFLLVAMTYINFMEERGVFEALKQKLTAMGVGASGIFWLTGILAFCISPFADNLTTALVMCSVVLSVGKSNAKFVCLSCINIVVAANAGGAFSPFGDITTLMVWQNGILSFTEFFALFFPALVTYLIPAIILFWALPKDAVATDQSEAMHLKGSALKYGARRSIWLFAATIVTAVVFENILHLPPALGMMTGLGYLMFFSYWIGHRQTKQAMAGESVDRFDIFRKVRNAEWDTLLFFYGILVCVQGLSALGYLAWASSFFYHDMSSVAPAVWTAHTQANTLVGVLSAIVDNIPTMFAILTMHPDMTQYQWLLVTLTVGTGGSLLSIGSAAGVAVMGKAKGYYTFGGHIKWIWAIALGYIAGIICHWLIAVFF